MSKSKIESTTAVFIYDRYNNLITDTIAEAMDVPGGSAFATNEFLPPRKSEVLSARAEGIIERRPPRLAFEQFRALPLFRHSAADIPRRRLVSVSRSYREIYFESHPEGPATNNVKPNSTRS